MSDEKRDLDLDAQAILARRKKLLAAAAVSLAISCEVRQETIKTNVDTPYTPPVEQPQICLSIFVEPPKSEPVSQPVTQPTTQPEVTIPPRPPCLSVLPPTVCLKIKKKCLSKKKPKIICLSEF
jgi:hypothetical protein